MSTEQKEERVLTLALSPEEARLVSVMYAFGLAVLGGVAVAPALGAIAVNAYNHVGEEARLTLSEKLITLDVEAKEGDERVVAEAARRLTFREE